MTAGRTTLRSRMRRIAIAVLAAASALLLTGWVHASAYNLEGWQEYWPNLTYGYMQDCQNLASGNQVPSWYRSYVTHAANNWNSSPTPVRLDATAQCGSNMFIQIDGYTANDGYGGHTYCSQEYQILNGTTPVPPAWCLGVVIQLNTGPTGAQTNTPAYDVYLPGHEFGHAVGLGHSGVAGALMAGPPYTSYSCPSATNCTTIPQQDDVNGANHMYPTYAQGDYNLGCSANNQGWYLVLNGLNGIQPPMARTASPPAAAALPSFDPAKAEQITSTGAYDLDQSSGKLGSSTSPLGMVAAPGPGCMSP